MIKNKIHEMYKKGKKKDKKPGPNLPKTVWKVPEATFYSMAGNVVGPA